MEGQLLGMSPVLTHELLDMDISNKYQWSSLYAQQARLPVKAKIFSHAATEKENWFFWQVQREDGLQEEVIVVRGVTG
jgi:hypothetical protein